MSSFSEAAIHSEAQRIWEASGRPIWSHPLDHWATAVGNLAKSPSDGAQLQPSADMATPRPGQSGKPLQRKAVR
ncbi:hypothetical protein K32_24730 [Kaistia sp. 32K]|nr:hypothetical protein K32_24730 [Kaistia sp. 32K]